MTRAVVVGGGLSGLVAARDLVVHHGIAPSGVTVLEARDRTGGVLLRGEVAGRTVDLGAESVLTSRPEATDLLAELGLADEAVHPTGMPAAVWSRGGIHPVPRGTLMGVPGDAAQTTGLLTDQEVARADDSGREHPPLVEDVSLGDLVAERLGDAVVDRLVEPLLGGVYAGHARRLSVRACLPALAEAAAEGRSLTEAVQAATARSGGGTQARPAPPFASLPGGLARLVEALTDDLVARGVTVRTGTPVEAVTRTDGGWEVRAAGQALPADAVLLAVPAPAAAALLRPELPAAADELAAVPTASMVVVTFAFPTAAMPPLDRSGFLVPPVDGRAIKASTFLSAKWPGVGDDEVTLVRASLGRAGDDLSDRTDDELGALALADVAQAVAEHTGADLPEPIELRVQRWPDGLPQYEVGHLERMARVADAVAAVPGLELAGSVYDGVGIPVCIGTARAAAARLVAGGRMDP